jgi:acyl carrier protein
MEGTRAAAAPADGGGADVSGEIIHALADMTASEPGSISRQTRIFDDLAFDSTSVLELLMQLEDTLGIEFDPFTLEPQDFETVGSLVDYVIRQSGG